MFGVDAGVIEVFTGRATNDRLVNYVTIM